jgi:sugar lactone lactonase YvrE
MTTRDLKPGYFPNSLITRIEITPKAHPMIRKVWIFTLSVAIALTLTQRSAIAQYGPPTSGSSSAILFTPATVGLIAGLNGQGSSGNGGLATAAKLNYPVGIAYDSSGNLFIADAQNYEVRRIDHVTGNISIFAGTGTFGNSLGGGVATSAQIGEVAGLVIDTGNNVYVSDRSNNVVWKITSGGTISVYAGGGTSGLGDGGPATAAELNNPWALGIDASNNIYISDSYNNLVRVVNHTTNIITTFAGDTADTTGCSGAGLYSTSTPPYLPTQAHLCFPEGVAFDSSGNAYIVDASTAIVRVVNKATGYISTFAGGGTQASSVNGIPATSAIIAPSGVFVDPGNRVYIASSNYVRVVDSSGNINTVFGTGSGSLSSASLGEPSTESININIGNTDGVYGMAMDTFGNLITASSSGNTILTAGTTGQYVFPQTQILTTETTTQANAASPYYPPSITVSNPSGVTLNFSAAPVVTGPFAVVTGTGAGTCVFPSGSVAAGQSCTIVVSFTPTLGGSPGTVQTGTVVLASNANSAPSTILLSGTGVGTATVSATLTPSLLTYASVAGVTSASQNATLKNTGQLPIAVGSTDFNGYNPTDFAVSSTTCPTGSATLAVGSSCTYSITFTPPAASSYQAGFQACVSTSSYGCLTSITVQGTGTASATATLLPNPLAFGSVIVGQTSATMSATLSNTSSTTAMTLTSFGITGTNAADFAVSTGTNACGSTLAANSSCIVYVTFTPASATSFSAQLSVADSATGSPQTAALTGTGTAAAVPIATLNPPQLSYPNTIIGSSSAAQTFTITNTGSGTLSVTSIALGGATPGDFTTSNNCITPLAAGAFCTVSVTFTPGFPRLSLASVLVTDNASGSPQSVVITGTGIAATPQATLSAPATFAATTVGSSAPTQVIALANPGNATLTITSIVISGTNASSFSTTTCGTTLAASATCLITIGFTPTAAGPLTATLTVTDNATAGSTQAVTLNGTGTAVLVPLATLSPTTLTFPSTTVGVAATSLPITLSNPGTAALTITSISVTNTSAGFGEANTCGSSLAAGASCTITVSFTPTAAGALAGSISVTDNATGSPQTVSLTGTGAAVLVPLATLAPTTLTFPSTTVGTSATSLPITLSNPGTAALAISNITITGTNATSFGQTNSCSASLAAGASCTITVSFTPTAAGALAASISVVDNATGSPQSVAITGSGAAVVTGSTTFTVASNTPTATVQPGGVAQYNLVIAPFGGTYNNLVTLSATGLPAGAQASFLPAAVTPGSAGAPSVMSIQTSTGLAHLELPSQQRNSPVPLLAMLAGLPLLGFAGNLRRLRRGRGRWMLLGLATLAILPLFALSGCGGGYFGPAPKTYTVTVIGTSGVLQQSTTVSLTVQ